MDAKTTLCFIRCIMIHVINHPISMDMGQSYVMTDQHQVDEHV